MLLFSSTNININMNYVRPINIPSPVTGEMMQPRIVKTERDGKIYTEAHWYCPSSGQFIRKGVVEIQDKKS